MKSTTRNTIVLQEVLEKLSEVDSTSGLYLLSCLKEPYERNTFIFFLLELKRYTPSLGGFSVKISKPNQHRKDYVGDCYPKNSYLISTGSNTMRPNHTYEFDLVEFRGSRNEAVINENYLTAWLKLARKIPN